MKNPIRYAQCLALYHIYKGRNPVADSAFLALTSPHFPTKPGMCQMFVRLVLEGALKRKIWPVNPGSAREAAQWLRRNLPSCEVKGDTQGGDVFYKEYQEGSFGHTGVLFYGGKFIIENSSADVDNNGDARGIRTRDEWGAPSFIARIL